MAVNLTPGHLRSTGPRLQNFVSCVFKRMLGVTAVFESRAADGRQCHGGPRKHRHCHLYILVHWFQIRARSLLDIQNSFRCQERARIKRSAHWLCHVRCIDIPRTMGLFLFQDPFDSGDGLAALRELNGDV